MRPVGYGAAMSRRRRIDAFVLVGLCLLLGVGTFVLIAGIIAGRVTRQT